MQRQATNLIDAISNHGISPLLSAQLATVETRLNEIDRMLAAKPSPKLPTFSDEQIRTFLRKECQDFCKVLTDNPELARQEIQKRITKLILTPKQTPDGAVLAVSGDIGLLRGGDVMLGSSLEETTQHYIGTSIPLAGVILDPSLPLAR